MDPILPLPPVTTPIAPVTAPPRTERVTRERRRRREDEDPPPRERPSDGHEDDGRPHVDVIA